MLAFALRNLNKLGMLTLEQYKGQHGVELMLQILYDDFKRCMQLTGCRSISDISPASLAIVNAYGPLARL